MLRSMPRCWRSPAGFQQLQGWGSVPGHAAVDSDPPQRSRPLCLKWQLPGCRAVPAPRWSPSAAACGGLRRPSGPVDGWRQTLGPWGTQALDRCYFAVCSPARNLLPGSAERPYHDRLWQKTVSVSV